MSKQEKKLVVTVGGRLLYPKKEGDTLKYALEMSKLTESKLLEMVKAEFPNDTLTIKPDKESGLPLLNVKSNYDIKVFDKDKKEINEHLNHGAEVYANVTIKPYKYMGKTGITAYISGVVLLQNGEGSTGNTYDSIMKNVI